MFVSDKLKVSAMLECDVYDSSHMYYITERFELCSIGPLFKFILNCKKNGTINVVNNILDMLYIQGKQEPIYIIKKFDDNKSGGWSSINYKRLRLYDKLNNKNKQN